MTIGRTLTHTEAVELMALELQALEGTPMEMAWRPLTVLQIAGLLQLALRHPDVGAEHRDVAWRLLDAVRQYFADCPTVLTVLDAGEDPTQDVPSRGSA